MMSVPSFEEDRSTRVTRAIANMTAWLGSFPAIFLSFLLVGGWFVGVFFVHGGFTNTNYQLIINTGTTIITFWMVFIIQNTHNRDGKAIQTKLDAQSYALQLIAEKLGEDVKVLSGLAGLEDAPEKVIDAEKTIVGRAFVRIWPLSRFKFL